MSHKNAYIIGASGTPIDSTQAGLGVSETYLALKNFSRIQLSSTVPTQLPNCPCGYVEVSNPLGNDTIFVGGLDGSGDTPYLDSNYPGQGRGTALLGGVTKTFRVANSNLLQIIALRDGDVIQIMPMLSQSDFQTPTNDPPPNPTYVAPLLVVSTLPPNGNIGVMQNAVIKILFNGQMDPNFVTSTNLTISPTSATMKMYLDPNNSSQVDIDPQGSNLLPNQLYTVTVTNTLQDIFGRTLASPYTFSFTTGTVAPPPVPPTVSSTTPANNAGGIGNHTTVTIIMSEAIQSATLTSSNVFMKDPNTTLVPGTLSLAADSKTITFTPSANLAFSSKYTVTVQGLKDLTGDTMTAPYVFSFTTVSFTQTQRYTVSEGSCHANDSCYPSSYYLQYGGKTYIGEKADSSQTNQKLVGFAITKVVIAKLNSHSSTHFTGSLTVEIRDANRNLKYAYASSFDVTPYSTSNTPVTSITIQDANNSYVMVNGDVIFVKWTNPNTSGMQIGTANGGSGPYGDLIFWDGTSSSYTVINNDDLAMTCYSTP